MTRKRFTKLLMSWGVPRNIAQREAKHQSNNRIPYCFAYHCLTLDLQLASALLAAATQATIALKEISGIIGLESET